MKNILKTLCILLITFTLTSCGDSGNNFSKDEIVLSLGHFEGSQTNNVFVQIGEEVIIVSSCFCGGDNVKSQDGLHFSIPTDKLISYEELALNFTDKEIAELFTEKFAKNNSGKFRLIRKVNNVRGNIEQEAIVAKPVEKKVKTPSTITKIIVQ